MDVLGGWNGQHSIRINYQVARVLDVSAIGTTC